MALHPAFSLCEIKPCFKFHVMWYIGWVELIDTTEVNKKGLKSPKLFYDFYKWLFCQLMLIELQFNEKERS